MVVCWSVNTSWFSLNWHEVSQLPHVWYGVNCQGKYIGVWDRRVQDVSDDVDLILFHCFWWPLWLVMCCIMLLAVYLYLGLLLCLFRVIAVLLLNVMPWFCAWVGLVLHEGSYYRVHLWKCEIVFIFLCVQIIEGFFLVCSGKHLMFYVYIDFVRSQNDVSKCWVCKVLVFLLF